MIHKFLKKGYVHFGNLCDSQLELKMGAPQGSIISPFICNILLHDLDGFADQYIKKYSNFDDRKIKISKDAKKIQYIRYADDIVLGLICDKRFAYKTLSVIANFS